MWTLLIFIQIHRDVISNNLLGRALEPSWFYHFTCYTHKTCWLALLEGPHNQPHLRAPKPFPPPLIEAGVIHRPENLSDHLPIYCKFSITTTKNFSEKREDCEKSKRYWKKADHDRKEAYRKDVEYGMLQVKVPHSALHCRNVHCTDDNHLLALDDLMLDTLKVLELSQYNNIPGKSGSKKSKQTIPLWKEQIDPYKEKAHFWHSVWLSAGRPINCELHKILTNLRKGVDKI